MTDTVIWPGLAISSGRAVGKTWVFEQAPQRASTPGKKPLTIESEVRRLKTAIIVVSDNLRQMETKVRVEQNEQSAQIFAAHLMLLNDPAFADAACQRITSMPKMSAELAITQVAEETMDMFNQLEDEYFCERSADIKDILQQVLAALDSHGEFNNQSQFPAEGNYIVVAEEMTPAQTVNLPLGRVLGFVVQKGGRTSHAAILARTYGIPAIIVSALPWDELKEVATARIDGDEGWFETLTPEQFEEAAAALAFAGKDDGCIELPEAFSRITLAANIGGPADLPFVQKFQAQGVGLYRTEFLFMGDKLPTEEEQVDAYRSVIADCRPHLCVIRTLDIGGDKQAPALDLPKEQNPFLGLRAIRLCLRQPEIFRTQLRAILRAAAFGRTAVMFPMITSVEELQQAKQYLVQAREEVLRAGYAAGEVEVGIMVEVPAAALIAGRLAKEVDFFSIGTNDLTQYTLAVDRENTAVASLGQYYHPAVLSLICQTVAAAKENDIWVGICGEAGGDALLAPYFWALGVDELSMAPGQLPKIRQRFSSLAAEKSQLETLIKSVHQCSTTDEVIRTLKMHDSISAASPNSCFTVA